MLVTNLLKIRDSQDPLLSLISLLEQLMELIKPVYSLDYGFIIKRHLRNSQIEEVYRPNWGKCQKILLPIYKRNSSQISVCLTNLEPLQILSFWGFTEASLHRHED